ETLRPSYQSHVLSTAWAQRQLKPRAFSIHDEARFSAIHARLHWLPLLLEHSLAVVEAREHTPKTCAKAKTDGPLNHYNEWASVSCSAQTRVARRGPTECLRVLNHPLFLCTAAVNPAKCPKWSIPASPCSGCVVPVARVLIGLTHIVTTHRPVC